jgi:hypothetical protein
MAKRTRSLSRSIIFSVAAITFLLVLVNLRAGEVSQIKLDIGRNIVETARASGVPEYSAREIAGLVSYSVDSLPDTLPVTFIRPGLEGTFAPLFAVTMYADHDNKNNLAVTDIVLQFSTDALNDHRSGQAFVESIVDKFKSKKWERHIETLCPAVTGRSSLLSLDGTIDGFEGCPLDPAFKIDPQDWRTLAKNALSYEWIGDGVLAHLDIHATEDSRGITYRISIEYSDHAIKTKRDEKNFAKRRVEGDKEGLNSTVQYKAGLIRIAKRVKILEANALQRGDTLVPRGPS